MSGEHHGGACNTRPIEDASKSSSQLACSAARSASIASFYLLCLNVLMIDRIQKAMRVHDLAIRSTRCPRSRTP